MSYLKKNTCVLFLFLLANNSYAGVCNLNNYTRSTDSGMKSSYVLSNLGSYGKESNKLYLNPNDCDTDDTNDVNLKLESIPCVGSDVNFTDAMNQSITYDSLKIANKNIDSTVMGNYDSIAKNFVKYAASNSSGRFCESPVDYNGKKNNISYCQKNQSFKIQAVYNADGTTVDQNACTVLLDRNLRVGESMVLTVQEYTPSSIGQSGFYTFGYATVSCDSNSGNGFNPTVTLDANDGTKCDVTDPNFYTNPSRECKQLCYWGKGLHCPEGKVTWSAGGVDHGNCSYDLGLGYLEEVVNVESQNNSYNGNATFRCEFGHWKLLGTSSTCSLKSN